MKSVTARLSEIKKEMEGESLSKDKKAKLRTEANELIVEENIELFNGKIEKMVKNGYSESKIWKYCQINIEEISDAQEWNKKSKERAQSFNLTDSETSKLLKIVIEALNANEDRLIKLKRFFLHCQIHYCKNYDPDISKSETEHFKSKKVKTEKAPTVNWLGTEKQLKVLFEYLKDNRLIEERNTKELIRYFNKYNKKVSPINWIKPKTLLAYLIECLDRKYISPLDLWKDTTPFFSWNGNHITSRQMSSSAYQFKKHNNRRPTDHHIIDEIISDLQNH